MPNYIALNQREHQNMGWKKLPNFAFSAGQSVATVLLEELPQLLPTLPLAFVKSPGASEQAAYELVALLSASPRLNLYLARDGRWLGGYIPAVFRGYPFRLLRQADSQNHVLCVDEESGMLVDAGDEGAMPFFDAGGQLTESMQRLIEFLKQFEQGYQRTRLAVEVLAAHKLIEPWPIQVHGGNEQKATLGDVYRVNEAALKALDGAALKALQNGNGLSLAYAQLFSQHRLGGLTRLYELRKVQDEQAAAQAQNGHGQNGQGRDLDTLFGEGDETLAFPWQEPEGGKNN